MQRHALGRGLGEAGRDFYSRRDTPNQLSETVVRRAIPATSDFRPLVPPRKQSDAKGGISPLASLCFRTTAPLPLDTVVASGAAVFSPSHPPPARDGCVAGQSVARRPSRI